MAKTHLQSHTYYWLAALHLPSIGPITFKRWMASYSDIKDLFTADTISLQQAGLTKKEMGLLKNINWTEVDHVAAWCEKTTTEVLTLQDPAYPDLLREISGAPLVLFVRGESKLLSKPQIAMVGSRHPTVTGCENAVQFACQLAAAGFVITSGLALGIDAASHKGALQAGNTIAVTGAGLANIYPESNRGLAEEIIEKGALISEFLPHILPKPKHFPLRNRIISGLSLGVLVVEAAMRSGSLITTQYALDQGREIFAIPGSIHNPLARGCHYLLRQGAKLVETAEDIIEELGGFSEMFSPPKDKEPGASQQRILEQIGYETTSLDTIIVRSGLTTGEVSSILLSLELENRIQSVIGGYIRMNDR